MVPPSRIVCLTEETVETLCLLGEQDRIGLSGYVVRPPQARREKPRAPTRSRARGRTGARPPSELIWKTWQRSGHPKLGLSAPDPANDASVSLLTSRIFLA
jgi:hypothetical protein